MDFSHGMQPILLVAGIGCVVVAIPGGGLRAMGADLPVINKTSRQILLGGFGAALIAWALFSGNSPVPPPTSTGTPTITETPTATGTDTASSNTETTAAPTFTGDWNSSTNFPLLPQINGRFVMTLVQDGEHVTGHYALESAPQNVIGVIDGAASGANLTYRWHAGNLAGGGVFTLSSNGRHMEGPVNYDAGAAGTWTADRQ